MYFKSIFFEDYQTGDKRVTLGRTITETDFVVHAGHTGDFSAPHGRRMVQNTTLSKAHCTWYHDLQHRHWLNGVGINPEAFSKGYDKLRFVKPVHIGDTIHSEITISAKGDAKKPEFGTVTEHVEVINQRGEVVLVCDHLLMAKRKASPNPSGGGA